MHAALRRQTLADLLRRTAKRFPNKTAIICGDTRWSYAEFDAVCDRSRGRACRARRRQGCARCHPVAQFARLCGAAVCAGAARRRAGADQFHAQARGSRLHPQARRRRNVGDRYRPRRGGANSSCARHQGPRADLAAVGGKDRDRARHDRFRGAVVQRRAAGSRSHRRRRRADRLHQRHGIAAEGRDAHA